MSPATAPKRPNPFLAAPKTRSAPQRGVHNLLRATEVAELLSVSRQMVHRYTASGELRSVRLGRNYRYLLPDVVAFVRSKRT